ncbi:CoA transferase [Deltaproteobacteria bacterium TL4]
MTIDHKNEMSSELLPLDGIRVLDFTQYLPGPYATFILTTLGAEVIKVEPASGEPARNLPPLFELLNRGKKSVVVDLKSEVDQHKLKACLPSIDIIIEGFRPGVMQKFGLGFFDIRSQYPQIIYCSMSGYGQAGPNADYPGHDLNYQAITGVCHMERDQEGHPRGTLLPIADLSSSLNAVCSLLAALYARQNDGKGRFIDVALTDTVCSWVQIWYEGLHPEHARLGDALTFASQWLEKQSQKAAVKKNNRFELLQTVLTSPGSLKWAHRFDQWIQTQPMLQEIERLRLYYLPHYNVFQTKDAHYLSIGIVDEDKFWRVLCEKLDLKPIGHWPLPVRGLAAIPLQRKIRKIIAKKTLAEWLEHFVLSEVPVFPVLPPREAVNNPQLKTRPVLRKGVLNSPLPLGRVPSEAPPLLGEHTEEFFERFGER